MRAMTIGYTTFLLGVFLASLAPAVPAGPVQTAPGPENEAVVVRLPDDELRIYYVHRPEGLEIHSIGSTDHGKTWGKPRTEFKLPGPAYYAVQVAVDRQGELQCVFHVRTEGTKGYRGRHYDLWHTKTSGQRTKWSEPKRFFEGYVGSIRALNVLPSGRLITAAGIAVPEREKPVEGQPDYGWHDTVVFYSDDDGATWTQGQDRLKVMQDNQRGRTRYGGVEPHLIPLQDGRLWMLIRTKNGQLWESVSTDNGTTWPQPKPSRFVSSDSPAASARLKDGRLVLFLNQCQRWDDLRSYAIGGRETLHAAISTDDGKTWHGFREVHWDPLPAGKGDRGTAYSSATETADGKVCLFTGQGEGRRAIILIEPDWLLETSARDDFRQGDRRWTLYDQKGAEIIKNEAVDSGKSLILRKADAKSAVGAVWNFPALPAGQFTVRLKLAPGSQGATISLTDHYSVAGDRLADQNAVVSLTVGPDGKVGNLQLRPDKWHDVTFRWDGGSDVKVQVDGQPATTLKPRRTPTFGLNYLRLSSPATEVDRAGYEVQSVEAKAATESAANTTR